MTETYSFPLNAFGYHYFSNVLVSADYSMSSGISSRVQNLVKFIDLPEGDNVTTDPAAQAVRQYADLHAEISGELRSIAEEQNRKVEAERVIGQADERMRESRRKLALLQRKLSNQSITVRGHRILDEPEAE